MTTIVLLGGNGYIGRAVTEEWINRDPTAKFYVISTSGTNKLTHPAITNLVADASEYRSVQEVLPETVDYIVDFLGRPEKDAAESAIINRRPAEIMKQIAEEKHVKAMGFVGGLLGPKHFVDTKKSIIQELKKSSVKLGYVEPTIVYGGDRHDNLAKMVPLFQVLGWFSKTMKPVKVEAVAKELVTAIVD